jgi:hypothetical protein
MAQDKKSEGVEPEALREFEAAARAGGKKPEEQGLEATPETAPLPDSSEREAKTATKILEAGAEQNPRAASEAIKANKDPRIP